MGQLFPLLPRVFQTSSCSCSVPSISFRSARWRLEHITGIILANTGVNWNSDRNIDISLISSMMYTLRWIRFEYATSWRRFDNWCEKVATDTFLILVNSYSSPRLIPAYTWRCLLHSNPLVIQDAMQSRFLTPSTQRLKKNKASL